MFRILKVMMWLLAALIFAACSSAPKKEIAPNLLESLTLPDIIKFPLQTTAQGRWIISVDIGEGRMADMLLDTGATYSAFYYDAAEKFNLTVDVDNVTRIHGLVTNAVAATTTIERLGFGADYFINKNFAVLPDDGETVENIMPSDGIIGMDIMEGYRIFVDASDSHIYFIPNTLPDFTLPINMRAIQLFSNPYVEAAPRLHFFSVEVRNKNVPALMDTGTDVHIINWHAATYVEARSIRSQLKWRWKVAGAIGEFKPVVRAHMDKLTSGPYEWQDVNMIIKDTDSLDILGVSENPVVIAGIGLFDNRNVYLDFQNDTLWLQNEYTLQDSSKTVTICLKC